MYMNHSASEIVSTMWVVSWNLVTSLFLHDQKLIQINQYDIFRSDWCVVDRVKVLNFNALYSHNREVYKEVIDTHSNLTFTLSVSKLRYRCFWWVKLGFVSFGIDVVIQHRYRSDNITNIYATRNLRPVLNSTQNIA